MTPSSIDESSRTVQALRTPKAFPEPAADVEVIETHKSWVFLAGEHVYKLKKTAQFNSVDHRNLADRYNNCLQEVKLNRRLARDVYLGVVPLNEAEGGEVSVAGEGETIDWLVKMQRLPADCALDRSIEQDCVDAADVRQVATVLADFYLREPPVELTPDEYRARIRKELSISRSALESMRGCDLGLDDVQIIDRISAFLSECTSMFDARVSGERIVEGHGDLRPSHVYLVEPRPVIIDCLEFDRQLRIVDPVDELGFLAMECASEGAEWIGPVLFNEYTKRSGDQFPGQLIDFYKAYRATTWARLAVWRLQEDGAVEPDRWVSRARNYLARARYYEQQSLTV